MAAAACLAAVCLSAISAAQFSAPQHKHTPTRRTCGTKKHDSAANKASDARFKAVLDAKTKDLLETERFDGPVPELKEVHRLVYRTAITNEPVLKVALRFIIVHSGTAGKVSPTRVAAQVASLNTAFSGSAPPNAYSPTRAWVQDINAPDAKIEFVHAGTTYLEDATHFANCHPGNSTATEAVDLEIKTQYVTDTTKYIHIISCELGGPIGMSTMPSDYDETNKEHTFYVVPDSFPDDSITDYQFDGDTANHEIGHFFGKCPPLPALTPSLQYPLPIRPPVASLFFW